MRNVVYQRAHNIKGRNKIQDAWDSTPYKVVRCPDGHGAVYAIALADGGGNTRNINRFELRPAYTSPDNPGLSDLVDPQELFRDKDGDMVMMSLMPESVSTQDKVQLQTRSHPLQEDNINSTLTSVVDYVEDHYAPQQEEVVRRTRRATAGCHSNPYNLPRSVCISETQLNGQVILPMQGLSNNRSTIGFRPWL